MSKVFVWCLVACLVALASSVPRPKDKFPVPDITLDNRPGVCSYRGHDFKEGETKPGPVGYCFNVTCRNATIGTEGVDIEPCDLFQVKEGCSLQDPDLKKLFPDCCAKEICP